MYENCIKVFNLFGYRCRIWYTTDYRYTEGLVTLVRTRAPFNDRGIEWTYDRRRRWLHGRLMIGR